MRGRWTIAAGLLIAMLTAACGGYDPPDPLRMRAVPRPDLCRDLRVTAALTTKVDSCVAESVEGRWGARFTGRAKKSVSVSVIVSYQQRYDQKTGFDLWEQVGVLSGEKGSVIGLGELSIFDPTTGTMAAVSDGLIVSVAFQSARPAAADTLAERLLDVIEQALELGRSPVTQSSPDRIRSSPEIRK